MGIAIKLNTILCSIFMVLIFLNFHNINIGNQDIDIIILSLALSLVVPARFMVGADIVVEDIGKLLCVNLWKLLA